MKKALKVNIAGQAFDIDEDAYKRLDRYLKALARHFHKEDAGQEIINDIEIRVAELLRARQSYGSKVINLDDIEEIIATMGYPEDFEDKDLGDVTSERVIETRRPKRLYRDPENRVLGGVCGGLGMYFNMDPLIIRILFVAVFLAFGVGLLVYIILWIVIPKAKTLSQKLEMRGEKVTISRIKDSVKDEYEDIKDSWKYQR
mgnify:CR=1 FL=1